MDAKYNWLIDNMTFRVTLNTVAFALWMATAVGLLEIASKLYPERPPLGSTSVRETTPRKEAPLFFSVERGFF